jgi:hypothetical protein
MKILYIAILLAGSFSTAMAADKPKTPNYITKTSPSYMSPKSGDSKKGESKSCVVVVEQNFFTKQATQTVKCY